MSDEYQKLVVAICSTTGPGSGKSTYLNRVVRKQLPDAKHMRFSDPLVTFVVAGLRDLHGMDIDAYESIKSMELIPGLSGRDVMIAAGEGIRSFYPSFFADVVISRISRATTRDIILDDLRKIAEIEALVNSGHRIMFVNVLKPRAEVENDAEFDRAFLARTVDNLHDPSRVRLMEVTWDESGYKTVMRGGSHGLL